MARYSAPLYLIFHIVWAWCFTEVAAAKEFYSIVERDGTVALCLFKGAILFSDRCAGSGRLTIVQPVKEGTVVWRSAIGTVSLENNTQNAECALSRAKWDPITEGVVSTGRKITKTDPSALLERLNKTVLKDAKLVESDIAAFELDLDNDGKEETVFVASNLKRVSNDNSKDGKEYPYMTRAGILPRTSNYPVVFFGDQGVYSGGTDAIGDVVIKGVVPIAPGTGEIALLIKAGSGLDGAQTLVRYRNGLVQRIDTIEFVCN
jgi:hypothetical protein